MSPGQDATLLERSIKIAFVVALYWVVSISMVFLNKYLLSEVSLDAPMFVTWFQCVVAVVTCFILGELRSYHPALEMFPRFAFDTHVAMKVLPLSLVFVGMIAFNNLALKFVGVAFYNVGRSLTTIFNVLLSFFMLQQRTSMPALLMCGVIVAGFFVGVNKEQEQADLTMAGIMYGVLASLCVALNAIYIKKVMPFVDNDMWKLTAYNNMNAIFLFLPVITFMGEIPDIAASEDVYSGNYWFLMTVAGLLGIAIGLVSMLQINVTSPLTHNISGTSKACAQTILALQLNDESRTATWWLGNVFVLGGSLGYVLVKRAEMKRDLEKVPSSADSKA
ncbi:uncharacterized protein MONBRDRAFT_18313 [Monosiga brevicollis MX1]|uniref:GDP-fucose transporter 1 n=1 Tax=Monosiga brevicollis TaxID=81824 RepID=FUCT1_MONBE|nr:uncharacterized protein MONBRDRAFT_18313 [Monosiga brevicollis MX1]A9UUB8.1 RecName: Full=GDP-fucose transporter 1; AltName: Full=Solute carrier family 35 member C1 homolog [Monosiga brevicollis]EDQ91067.1 predicted protein [Monosiga brevicollis MX1]|eukprot:XP_001744364.1 hypothetical protein [Monosiga brevicollis MX1]